MIKLSWDEKFNLQISCELQLPIEAGEKLLILSEFSQIYNKSENFIKWYNNPDVPGIDKDPFNIHMMNAKAGLYYVYKFAQNCGCTELEIKEFTKIPF